MKKLLFIFTLIFLTIFSFGQELKTKKKKENCQEGTAHFHVLASNDSIKHGDYQLKGYSGRRVLLKGTYDNNKKVGLWIEQYYGKYYKGPKATGFYDNDQKTGDWTYFNYKGDTIQIYNWTENKIIFSKPCGTDKNKYTVIVNEKEDKITLDCPPICVSGSDYFLYEFSLEIGNYPDLFKKIDNNWSQLKTKISITIDKNASIIDISYSTDEKEELVKIIENFIHSYNWIPGSKDGKKFTTKFDFSVDLLSQI